MFLVNHILAEYIFLVTSLKARYTNGKKELNRMVKFYTYPKCSTCRNAKKWLEANGIEFEEIHLIENPPTKEQLEEIVNKFSLDTKKLFNTSGQKYRELGLKDQLATMSKDEQLALLASNGMLIKRPLLVMDQKVVTGFKEDIYKNLFL